MTSDSYLSLFALIVILSWWPIIIFILLSSCLHLLLICLLHGEELITTIYLFQILSSVSTFFSIDLQQLCFNIVHLWHKKALFIKQEWSSTITEYSQTTAVFKTGKKTVEYAFFYFNKYST